MSDAEYFDPYSHPVSEGVRHGGPVRHSDA